MISIPTPPGTAFPLPRSVGPGSTLAVVAPSSPFNRERFEQGLAWLRTRYEVRHEESIHAEQGYLAGSDQRRLGELLRALRDPEVDAILCARGGYGAARLLPGIPLEEVADANKLLAGFSDATALHALWSRAGVRSLHAPMVASLAAASEAVRQEWILALECRDTPEIWDLEALAPGTAEGRLCGGNLAVLAALAGTPHAPPAEGCLLFLEDVGEKPYRIDRMLTTLLQAGWLDRAAGVIAGRFTGADPGDDGITAEEVLRERLGALGIPVAWGFPAGHVDDNEPLTFGATARIEEGRVTLDLG